MPIYIDRHDMGTEGLTAEDVAAAHQKDVSVQDKYGANFLTYWFDSKRGTVFCLIEAPNAEAAMDVHKEAHGAVAAEIIPVELSAVEAFLGRIADPAPADGTERPDMEPALRAVMFTDIVNSTEMTKRLGDARAVEMVRAHDAIVRRALKESCGREVKHTGDGIMAAFDDVATAVESCCAIMRDLDEFNAQGEELINVRIGLHAGEPVQDSNDLFGATVQMASRICGDAAVDDIVISEAVRELAGDRFKLTALGRRVLKGFAEPVALYSVGWRNS